VLVQPIVLKKRDFLTLLPTEGNVKEKKVKITCNKP
jgi:hypothetical protein